MNKYIDIDPRPQKYQQTTQIERNNLITELQSLTDSELKYPNGPMWTASYKLKYDYETCELDQERKEMLQPCDKFLNEFMDTIALEVFDLDEEIHELCSKFNHVIMLRWGKKFLI